MEACDFRKVSVYLEQRLRPLRWYRSIRATGACVDRVVTIEPYAFLKKAVNIYCFMTRGPELGLDVLCYTVPSITVVLEAWPIGPRGVLSRKITVLVSQWLLNSTFFRALPTTSPPLQMMLNTTQSKPLLKLLIQHRLQLHRQRFPAPRNVLQKLVFQVICRFRSAPKRFETRRFEGARLNVIS